MFFLFTRKIKAGLFVITVVGYFLIFFLLNLYFTELIDLLTGKIYYLTYTFLEYAFFTAMFLFIIKNKKVSNIVILCSVLFTGFLIIYYLSVNIKRIDSVPIGIETIIILIYIVFYFYQYLGKAHNRKIFNDPGFWIIMGIFIYMGGTFFMNILAEYITHEEMLRFWHYTYLFDLIKNLLMSVSIIILAKYPLDNIAEKEPKQPFLDMDPEN